MCSEGVDDLGGLLTHLQPGLFRCSDVGACVWCDQLLQALDLLTAPEFAVPVLFGAGWSHYAGAVWDLVQPVGLALA
jgi:hypothetical protein